MLGQPWGHGTPHQLRNPGAEPGDTLPRVFCFTRMSKASMASLYASFMGSSWPFLRAQWKVCHDCFCGLESGVRKFNAPAPQIAGITRGTRLTPIAPLQPQVSDGKAPITKSSRSRAILKAQVSPQSSTQPLNLLGVSENRGPLI